jgi:selenocysteine-specific elongation factor
VSGALRVVATAGHVDHGKSSLIVALTGIDPDRFAEEKRRGLTIDLGYAWTTLPSGNEIGFVDVPGHERFIRNMLAGVGPVRLVLFVVAADEGWKPQSEEHLQILDVLDVAGGVIALTKRDLVDAETLAIAAEEVRERVAGTVLEGAPVVPVSGTTGDGVDRLRAALDEMVASAPVPPDARTRLFVDRVFTIAGAGTVVTGTLTGGCLAVDDEVQLHPQGIRARIRGLQSHKHPVRRLCHVSRAAANLVGVDRVGIARGQVATEPGAFRPTTAFDALLRPVRGLNRLPARGAFTVHMGAGETPARLRILEHRDDASALVRVRTDVALALDLFDRVVVWESGRRRTVGGGVVLDVAPPRAADARHVAFLARRAAAPTREEVAALLVAEAGAIRAQQLGVVTGTTPPEPPANGWCLSQDFERDVGGEATAYLQRAHDDRPLEEGVPLPEIREVIAAAARAAGGPADPDLADAVLARLRAIGEVARSSGTVRLTSHRVELAGHEAELGRLLNAVSGAREATPPTIKELVATGIPRDLIDAAGRAGVVVRLNDELVVAPELVARATELVEAHPKGITVSALREALQTSRRYAVPLLEWMDATGITRRAGDLRFPRNEEAATR